MLLARLSLTLAPLLGLLPCHVLAAEYYWPQQKGDVNRTGYSPYVVTSRFDKAPTWVWKDPHKDVIRATPLIDDKKNIYLGTQAGRIYKFSPDGKMLWSYRSRRGNTPTVSSIMDGSLYFNTMYGYVVALDMETGKERWANQISWSTGPDTACVFAINNTIVSATRQSPGSNPTNNLVVAVNADGTERWRFKHDWPTFNFQASSPGDGTMVFQDHFGGLYRLSLDDGHLIWESGIPATERQPHFFTTGAAVCGPNGLVYVASNYHGMGIIHAYRLEDGQRVWRKDMGMPVNQAVAYGVIAGSDRPAIVAGIGDNPLYPAIFSLPGWAPVWFSKIYNRLSVWAEGKPTWFWRTRELPAAIVALEPDTGDIRWAYKPPPFTRPASEGDEDWFYDREDEDAKFHDYKIDTICLPDDWAQAIIGGDGTTYVGHQDGRLYAVKDTNGNQIIEDSEVSTYYFGHSFQGSQAIAPGMLAVTPCGSGLYVWKS